MKKALILLLTGLLSLSPVVANAQAANPPPATVTSVMAAVRRASAADRQKLVQDAIKADPTISSALVAALIEAFPTEAAAFTKTVVDTVVALTVTTEVKSAILTAVASAAVPAALQIPPAAVTDLVAAVNAVKAALANVPPDLTPAVAQYITPITADSKEVIIQNDTQNKEVVSSDTL